MNFLGIDYGRKRIGVAIAKTSLAEPLVVLGSTEKLLPSLQALCHKHQVTTIIMGVSEGAMAEETKAFARKLGLGLNLPVHLHDETLTSVEASEKMLHSKKSRRNLPQDAYQASVMLQDYLDTQIRKKGMLE